MSKKPIPEDRAYIADPLLSPVRVKYQRRWRLADVNGKSVAEGFTSPAKAEQWAAEHGLEVEAAPKK